MNDQEMTVGVMIELLSQMPKDAVLRMATQPNWPFENRVGEPVLVESEMGSAVYLPEGDQFGYLPGEAAVLLRWADEDLGSREV